MKKIIIDTNFLLIPGIIGYDIFEGIRQVMEEPYEIQVLDGTLKELKIIIDKQERKFRQAAKMALELVRKKNIRIIKQKSLYMNPDSKNSIVDDIILEFADEETIVATQDKDLKNKLKQKGIKTLILRNKKQLELR